MKIFSIPFAFQLLFYTGSNIKKEFYKPLVKELVAELPIDNIQYKSFPCEKPTFLNDTVIISHSFGGYLALKDYIQNSTNIKGLILVNSHTNNGKSMPYPSIPNSDIQVPYLVINGEKDGRLSKYAVLEDYWDLMEDNNVAFCNYILKPEWGHFDAFEPEHVHELSNIIKSFLSSKIIKTETKKEMKINHESLSREMFTKYGYNKQNIMRNCYSYDSSIGFFDYLLKLNVPEFHYKWIHFVLFLSSSPKSFNVLYTDAKKNILFKSKHVSQQEFENGYKNHFESKEISESIVFFPKKLPTNLYGLYTWLLCSPTIRHVDGKINVSYFYLPLPDDRVYYKIKNSKKVVKLHTVVYCE